jgi:hypothetical protein
MDVKEAVDIAKKHAGIVFEGETPRIEEVWFDALTSEWCVTVGLQRPELASANDIALGRRNFASRMHYKTIRIDDTKREIKSVRNHEKTPVAST